MLTKAILAWRVGGLKFRSAWKVYNTQRGIGIGCVFPMCSGIDEWSHLFECIFYDTKVRGHIDNKADIAQLIVNISRECAIKVKLPLI